MASTIGPSPPSDHLSLESIPTVDLRLLSQSELTALSLCSSHAFDLRRCDDVVIPKIDRSVFNESAGSRKQTYSRLRLAPRNPSNNGGNSTNNLPKPRTSPLSSSSFSSNNDSDNSRIISLFKALFNGETIPENSNDNEYLYNDDAYDNDASALVPVNVEYSDSFLGGGGDGGGERKRKRGRKPRGGGCGDMSLAVTTIETVTEPIVTTEMAEAMVVDEEEWRKEEAARKEAREKEEAAKKEEMEKEEAAKKEQREKELVNKSGEVVDLRELAKKEDPYREEITRRTQGRESPEELLDFIRDLDGVWGSRRKKRKIVDANQFGDALPIGWKVLIAMKKKQGRAWVFCRRYISPNGQYFVSCKEVSSYLFSLTSPDDLKQQIDVHCPEASVAENKNSSENATDLGTKVEYPSLCVTPQSNDHKTLQKSISTSTSQSIDHEKQLVLFTNVHSEEVHAASALKCHKCSTGFGEKDELLNHLLSCHKRKRRKSGAPIEDDIMMKDGKYECQFCNKVFHERSSYFGHVGIHVKNYVKSIGGSPGLTVTSKQTSFDVSVSEAPVSVAVTEVPASISVSEGPVSVSVAEVPVSVSVTKVPVSVSVPEVSVSISVDEVPESVSVDEVPVSGFVDEVPATVSETVGDVESNVVPIASAPNISASSELHLTENKPEAGCEAESHLGYVKIDQNNLALHAELIREDVQSNKISAYESPGKNNEPAHTTDNNVSEVEEAVEFSEMKPDTCSGSEELYSSDNNDLCENLCEINAAECVGSEISKASAELVENDETCLLSGSKQVDLGHDDHSAPNLLQREAVASETDLCAENKENSSNDQNSRFKSFGNDNVKHRCFTEGLEVREEGGLMHNSDSGHLDVDIDMEDDVQDPGSLDECSNVLHKEEEEACDTTANRIEFMNSPLVASYENSSPSEDQPTNVMENYVGKDFIGIISEAEVDMCSLDDTEATVDTDRRMAEERPESCAALLSKNNGCGYIANEAETIPHIEMVEPRDTGAFQVEQTCTLEKIPRELFDRNEEPKSDQVMNSSNLFFTSGSNNPHLAASVISSNVQAHRDVSNVLGGFNNFVEDKQEEIPKNIIPSLTINEHLREVAMNNVTDVPSSTSTTQLPELDKVDDSRTNKLIFDFGNITEMNARFLSSVQNEAAPGGTSPFSLWGQQTCAIEDNQNRVYDGARGVQQERASDNNPLNMIGLQQPSDVRYNLNEVCMNEQRYGVQHNESGVYRDNNEVRREGIYGGARGIVQQERNSDNSSLNLFGIQQPSHAGFNLNKSHMNEQRYGVQLNESGVYSKSNDSRRDGGISHGNTLNLAGLQQRCDAGYNLNKPCINQQSYGLHCNDSGAYSTSDESKQERGTYGNSLSLASAPQTCETRYSLNKSCIQQTCDTGFSLNKGYVGTMQGLPKLDELGHSRDQDLMLGFRHSNGRPNQGVATEYLWRATEGSMLPGGLMDSSATQGQSSGSYQAFDFLSDKGGNDLYAANEKFDNLSSFEGLRSTNVEPMEFSFMTTQESNAQLGHQKVMTFNPQMDQSFGSTVWHQKPSLPNMMAGHVVSTLCVWCGNQFHLDSLNCEMQAGSIGYLCPTCKARMSGQFL